MAKFSFRYILVILWGVTAIVLVQSKRELQLLLGSAIASGGLIALASIYKWLSDTSLHRVAGFFFAAGGQGFVGQASFNEIGALHSICVLLCTCILIRSREINRAGYIALGFLNILGLLLTNSRSAMLALIVGILFLFGSTSNKILTAAGKLRRLVVPLLLIVVATYSYVVIIQIGLVDRLTSSIELTTNANISAFARLDRWKMGFETIQSSAKSLLIGNGPGYLDSEFGAATTESYYLDQLVTLGLLGGIIGILLITLPGFRMWKRRRVEGYAREGLCVAIAVGTVGLTGNVIVDPTLGSISFALLYACWGYSDRGVNPIFETA